MSQIISIQSASMVFDAEEEKRKQVEEWRRPLDPLQLNAWWHGALASILSIHTGHRIAGKEKQAS